jgi:hypothetical protein
MTKRESVLKENLLVRTRSLRLPGLVSTLRNRHFFLLGILILLITPTLALAFRLDFHNLPGQHTSGLLAFTLLSLVVYPSTFYLFGIYRRYWQ